MPSSESRLRLLAKGLAGSAIALQLQTPVEGAAPTPQEDRRSISHGGLTSSLLLSVRYCSSASTAESVKIPETTTQVVDRLLAQLELALEGGDAEVIADLSNRLERWQALEALEIRKRWEESLEGGLDGGRAELEQIREFLDQYAENPPG